MLAAQPELVMNVRIKSKKRLVREKPEPLFEPGKINEGGKSMKGGIIEWRGNPAGM